MKRLLHFFWFDYHRHSLDAGVYQYSNLEIQKWAERELERHFAVHSTSCMTQGRVTLNPQDVLIGNLTWVNAADPKLGASERNWVRDNRLEDRAACHPNTYILTPWVPMFPEEWIEHIPYAEAQLEAAKLVFGICGPIWEEQTQALDDDSIQCRVKSKLVRLNMCVNYDALRVRKQKFNPRGQRKLIHVSNLGSYKGFDLLLDSTSGVTVPSIGGKALPDVARGMRKINAFGSSYAINHIGPVNNGDDAQIRALVDEHDFYIHTASMDAQATTTLEFAARGLVPIVTPESGFDGPDAIYLTRYASKNKDIIAKALEMKEDELVYRSTRIMEKIRREHSWDKFYDTIAEHINRTAT